MSDCRADRLKSREGDGGRPLRQPGLPRPTPISAICWRARTLTRCSSPRATAGTRLASIYAARAGKDIYCEKPISLTIGEGREPGGDLPPLRHDLPGGHPAALDRSYRFAVEMVRQGRIGRVHTVEMQVWTGPAIPHDKAAPVPAGLGLRHLAGPVPWHPFVPGAGQRAGTISGTPAKGMHTDMGCHYTDQMQWALGTDHTGPVEFEAKGELARPGEVHERHAHHRRRFAAVTPTASPASCISGGRSRTATSATSATRAGSRWTTRPTWSPPSRSPF